MPIDIPDMTIASKGVQPNALNTLSDIFKLKSQQQGLQLGQQSLQSNDMALQSQTQANQERQNVNQFMSNPDNWQTDGKPDMGKLNAAIPKIAPQTGGAVLEKMNQLGQAQTQFQQSSQNLTTSQRAIVAGPLAILGRQNIQDPNVYLSEMDQLAKQYPNDKDMQKLIAANKTILSQMPAGPHVADGAIRASQALMSPDAQQSQLSPQTGTIDTGGGIQPVITTPSVGVNAPSISKAGTPIGKTLPPTTQRFNPQTGQMEFIGQTQDQAQQSGPQGLDLSKLSPVEQQFLARQNPAAFANGAAQFQQTSNAQQVQRSPVAASAPIGMAESIGGTVGAINAHWANTQASANNAQQDIGVLQNIKQHAAGAATGVGADRQALVAGIAGLLGMDKGELAKTNTDLLAKNSNMLALAGGDTNLARTMAEAATPNSHMTKEAITQAADQVIAQRKLALARAQFLTPFKAMADQGHPEMYNNALNQFNSVADPRVIQFNSMTPEEKSAMKSSMTPQERNDFGSKLGKARQLGIAQ